VFFLSSGSSHNGGKRSLQEGVQSIGIRVNSSLVKMSCIGIRMEVDGKCINHRQCGSPRIARLFEAGVMTLVIKLTNKRQDAPPA